MRQGGVLSPLLFDVYVNELSELLNKSGIGGNLGGTLINHMLYADDICIVSLSSSGLQHLLNICSDYCERHDLTFNAKKSMCMYFSNMFVSRGIPSFAELLRKSIYKFTKRIEVSSNSIIAACLSQLLYISSPVRKWWSSVLYVN